MNITNATSVFQNNSKQIEQLHPLFESKFGKESPIVRGSDDEDMFSSIFQSAVNSINKTNGYLSDAENEEIKLALGETDSTHDLAIALQKASTALQYTVAVRDKFIEAYRELINMQF